MKINPSVKTIHRLFDNLMLACLLRFECSRVLEVQVRERLTPMLLLVIHAELVSNGTPLAKQGLILSKITGSRREP